MFAGCGRREPPTFMALDLIETLPQAERRGATAPGAPTALAALGNDVRPAIVVGMPSRITWRRVRFPKRTVLKTAVGTRTAGPAQVVFRIGISDDRTYEELVRQVIDARTSRWTDVQVDLSRYAGWQWSVFYHPDRRCWNVIFNVATLAPVPDVVGFWAQPALYTAPGAGRDFLHQSQPVTCP